MILTEDSSASIAGTRAPNITTQKNDSNATCVDSNGPWFRAREYVQDAIEHILSIPGSIPADAPRVTDRLWIKSKEVTVMASNRLIDRLVAKVKTEVLEQVKDALVREMTEHLVEDVMRDFRDPAIRSDVAEKISYKAMERLSLDNIADAVADHYITHDFKESNITDRVCEQLSESGWFGDEAEDAIVDCIRDGLDQESMVSRIAKRVAGMVDLREVETDVVKMMTEELKQELVD